jgi:LPS-assembly lipoprotein
MVKTPSEYIKQTGIDRDATTTREQLRLKTSAKLISKETGRILFDRDFVSLTNYNILPSEYSTLIAQEDARDRAMRQIADDIKTHLALYFSNNDLPDSQ